MNLKFESQLRPCYVTKYKSDTKKPWMIEKDGTTNALFHCWEHISEVIAPSPLAGGHSGGVVSGILGIVEFSNGSIGKVKPEDITFIDNKFEEYACFVEDNHNPLEHPERYLEDTMAIVDDMAMAQRKALLQYLEIVIKNNGGGSHSDLH